MNGKEQATIFIVIIASFLVLLAAGASKSSVVLVPGGWLTLWLVYRGYRRRKKQEQKDFQQWAIENEPNYTPPTVEEKRIIEEATQKANQVTNFRIAGIVVAAIAVIVTIGMFVPKPKPYINPNYPNVPDGPPKYVVPKVDASLLSKYKKEDSVFVKIIRTAASETNRNKYADILKMNKQITNDYLNYIGIRQLYKDSLIAAIPAGDTYRIKGFWKVMLLSGSYLREKSPNLADVLADIKVDWYNKGWFQKL